ncbi:MAG: VOC family protein [Alphaproteobacteria bacterium]
MSGPGTFMWNELCTTDTDKAKGFFAEVVGWQTREMDMGEAGSYTIFQSDGKDVGGMLKMEGEHWAGIPPHWMAYIHVADVDAAVGTATRLGGAVKMPPRDIPGVGRISWIADPTGAVVALMTPEAKAE